MALNTPHIFELDAVKKEFNVTLKENIKSIESKMLLNSYEAFVKQFNTKDYTLIIDCKDITLDFQEFLNVYEDFKQILNQPSIGTMLALSMLSNDLFNNIVIMVTIEDEADDETETKQIFDLIFNKLNVSNYSILVTKD